MTKLEQIEKNVTELGPEDFKAFAEWFETLQASRWDKQMEADVAAGKLDRLADKALADFRIGKTKAL
ncbi:hypothetical protein [Rhizobium sp. BK602]|uniref:hypothetical protein n=1 Tax=Rhizobium sp. BK602 TaxID=2586986 RepID=UPI00161DF647|nr:hypothetical protein [Rhizobium sp. BK602]MBB3607174.1 hypothetical protein [Rhizobium sp. BK602]